MKTRRILSLLLVLAMLCGLMLFSASATGSYENSVTVIYNDNDVMTLSIGDTDHPTWPESNMYFDQVSGTTYNAVYSTNGTSPDPNYYPSLLSMYIVPATGVTINSISGTDVTFVTYASDGTPSTSTSCTVNSEGFYAICPQASTSKIVITPDTGSPVTVHFAQPVTQTSSGGTTPLKVCGYLPIGQFARSNSMGWGGIYTDGSNDYDPQKTQKFINGYVSTGVSLGMLGGYVQFEFENAIGNDADNPYGIDFIVYGNPFSGNPEAGSVMVYGYNAAAEAYGWYNLAGSRHYAAGTVKNMNISYVRLEAANTTLNSAFTAAGIYYSTNYVVPGENDSVNTAIHNATWNKIPQKNGSSPATYTWWPEKADSENYEQTWKMWTSANGATVDSHVGGVFWDTSETTASTQVITYQGVVKVEDDDVGVPAGGTSADHTNFYRFGYADVRQNGTNYGVAVNPYATLPSAAVGGDGFDLSWAVDAEGKPVTLTDVKFVRVYSAVLFNAPPFGETSTEVCGIYVASGQGTGQTTSVQGASLSVTWDDNGSVSNPILGSTITDANTFNVDAGTEITVTFSSSGNYIFVNEEAGIDSASLHITLGDGDKQIIRVIAKDSTTGLPYIGYMKLRGVMPEDG